MAVAVVVGKHFCVKGSSVSVTQTFGKRKVMGIDWRYGIGRMTNGIVTYNSTTNVCMLSHVWNNISCCR
jgi:hypothetical protein